MITTTQVNATCSPSISKARTHIDILPPLSTYNTILSTFPKFFLMMDYAKSVDQVDIDNSNNNLAHNHRHRP